MGRSLHRLSGERGENSSRWRISDERGGRGRWAVVCKDYLMSGSFQMYLMSGVGVVGFSSKTIWWASGRGFFPKKATLIVERKEGKRARTVNLTVMWPVHVRSAIKIKDGTQLCVFCARIINRIGNTLTSHSWFRIMYVQANPHKRHIYHRLMQFKASLNPQIHPQRCLHRVRSTLIFDFFIGIAVLAFRCAYPILSPCESAESERWGYNPADNPPAMSTRLVPLVSDETRVLRRKRCLLKFEDETTWKKYVPCSAVVPLLVRSPAQVPLVTWQRDTQ